MPGAASRKESKRTASRIQRSGKRGRAQMPLASAEGAPGLRRAPICWSAANKSHPGRVSRDLRRPIRPRAWHAASRVSPRTGRRRTIFPPVAAATRREQKRGAPGLARTCVVGLKRSCLPFWSQVARSDGKCRFYTFRRVRCCKLRGATTPRRRVIGDFWSAFRGRAELGQHGDWKRCGASSAPRLGFARALAAFTAPAARCSRSWHSAETAVESPTVWARRGKLVRRPRPTSFTLRRPTRLRFSVAGPRFESLTDSGSSLSCSRFIRGSGDGFGFAECLSVASFRGPQ